MAAPRNRSLQAAWFNLVPATEGEAKRGIPRGAVLPIVVVPDWWPKRQT